MSKKRLYEIARELGKESKEVVTRAKELGIEVKSHSSSVEASEASRIAASFSGNIKAEKQVETPKPAPAVKEEKPTPAPKPAVDKVADKSAQPLPEKKEATPVANKPQSRNFKAEREARAKEQAERRKMVTTASKIATNKEESAMNVLKKVVETRTASRTIAVKTMTVVISKIATSKVRTAEMIATIKTKAVVQHNRDHTSTLRRVQQP